MIRYRCWVTREILVILGVILMNKIKVFNLHIFLADGYEMDSDN